MRLQAPQVDVRNGVGVSARIGLGVYGGSLVWGLTENRDLALMLSVTAIPGWGLGISWGVSPTSTVIVEEKTFR